MQSLVADVLAAWRAAERVAMENDPGTPEYATAILAVDRLRSLYAELVSAAKAGETDPAAHRSILDAVRLPATLTGR